MFERNLWTEGCSTGQLKVFFEVQLALEAADGVVSYDMSEQDRTREEPLLERLRKGLPAILGRSFQLEPFGSYLCICIGVYIYIYIYIHIHTYIHTYIHTHVVLCYMYVIYCNMIYHNVT